MGQFRSRHIRVKYEKLKKKQLDLAKEQRKNNFRKKNWLLANAIVDIDLEQEKFNTTAVKDLFFYSRSFSALNTHPFFDATVKFQGLHLWFDRIQLLVTKNTCFYVKKKLPNGVVFFLSSISIFFTEILTFFKEQTLVFFRELSYNRFKFPYLFKGYYVILSPQSGDFLSFSSLVSFLCENNFFISQDPNILMLGFFYNEIFYSIQVLVNFFQIYRSLFLLKLEVGDFEAFKTEISIILNEINDVLSRKDLETSKEIISAPLLKQYEVQDLVFLEQSFLKHNILEEEKIVSSCNTLSVKTTKSNLYLIDLLTVNFNSTFNDCFFFSNLFIN